MKVFKSHSRFAVLVLSSIFSIATFAAEPVINESKDNEVAVSEQKTDTPSDVKNYRDEMDERRRQVQQAQQEAYQRHIERRKQYLANRPGSAVYNEQDFNNNVPAHIQQRRNEFIKQMEERRSMNAKMMDQNRKDAEQRKAKMLKIQQTNAPEPVKKM